MVRGLEGPKLEEWLAKVEQAVALSQLTDLQLVGHNELAGQKISHGIMANLF